MKNTMLITVEEFLKNGGELYKNDGKRRLYNEYGVEFSLQDDDLYRWATEDKKNEYYVQVACTPIYV